MRILVADPLSAEAVELLAVAGFEVVERHGLAGPALAQALAGVAGLLVRGATRVTRPALAGADALRVVCRAGSGTDNIDLDACRERGIAVFNTPGANSVSVAELTWALILALHRQVPRAAASTAAGRWEKSGLAGHEVRGRTLGLLGLGRVGTEVARLGVAFGCRVLFYDPFVPAPGPLPLVEKSDLDTLLAESDVVSLHAPLAAETRGVLDAGRLARMKPGALLVNCARGGLVDEEALERALVEGRLAGAALDVFASEPPAGSPLLRLPQVIATPHIGASTEEAQRRAAVSAASTVRDYLATGQAPGRVA